MASDDSLPTIKVLLIGPSGAGKSACKEVIETEVTNTHGMLMPCTVLTRYCDDEFDPDSSTATIGIDFKVLPSTITQGSRMGTAVLHLSAGSSAMKLL
jgi:Ras-related protein Rab-18